MSEHLHKDRINSVPSEEGRLQPTFEDADGAPRKSAFVWHLAATSYCIALLTIVAAMLRISFLGSKSLWLDEGVIAYRVALPLKSLIRVLTRSETNMYLYYFLMHGWLRVAGSSEFMLRLPSAIFDTLTVPLVYMLGVELRDRRTGLLAALLLAINATCIQYAQTARSYSLFVMLIVLSSIFFIRGVKRPSASTLACYITCGTCSVYAHLFGICALPSQWLSLFTFRPRIRTAIRLTMCSLTIAILSVPVFLFAIVYEHGQAAWIPRTSLLSVVKLFSIFSGAVETFNSAQLDRYQSSVALLLFCLYIGGIGIALVSAERQDWPLIGYLVLSICLPIGLTIAISFVKPMFVPRYLLPGLPFFVMLAAIGLSRISSPILAFGIVLTICVLGLSEDYAYYRAAPTQDWRGTVNFLVARAEVGDILLVYPGYYLTPIHYYVSRLDRPQDFPSMVFLSPVANDWSRIESLERILTELRVNKRRRIWFTFPAWESTGQSALRVVADDRRVVIDQEFPGVRLFLLEAAPEASR